MHKCTTAAHGGTYICTGMRSPEMHPQSHRRHTITYAHEHTPAKTHRHICKRTCAHAQAHACTRAITQARTHKCARTCWPWLPKACGLCAYLLHERGSYWTAGLVFELDLYKAIYMFSFPFLYSAGPNQVGPGSVLVSCVNASKLSCESAGFRQAASARRCLRPRVASFFLLSLKFSACSTAFCIQKEIERAIQEECVCPMTTHKLLLLDALLRRGARSSICQTADSPVVIHSASFCSFFMFPYFKARRLVMLLDVWYDRRRRLLLSSRVDICELFGRGGQ
eukprot:3542170-Pleurochrysis_carterae.AAC.1